MMHRRDFLRAMGGAGSAAVVGYRPRSALAEPPPETTRIRLVRSPAICISPLYLAEELLRGEGFSEIEYVAFKTGNLFTQAVAAGQVDLALNFIGPLVVSVDERAPVVILSGVHAGCFELFGSERVRAIRDLKGKTVAIPGNGEPQHVFLASMLSYVGIDPRADVRWVTHPFAESTRLFAEGKIDGYLGVAPEPQELRARKIGRVLINTLTDRPWSQYFCCLAAGNREFVRKNPVATKRVLRALLKAIDLCVSQPERAARLMVDRGIAPNYDHVLQSVKEIGYRRWREYDAEDTMRFWSLRLHEVGIVKSDPKKLLAQGTDWRFIEQLKRELKT